MEYVEAVKKIQNRKPKDNFMVIELGYNNKLLLPFKDALVLMSALANAEKLQEDYQEPLRIVPIERDTIKSHILSSEEYEQIKIAGLLNITLEEVKEFALASP